ncbi:MAG: hypothetical protein MRY63_00355 [Neomegalonema sp.]|nr:hypothetical protein [Neomegalonema sp.]
MKTQHIPSDGWVTRKIGSLPYWERMDGQIRICRDPYDGKKPYYIMWQGPRLWHEYRLSAVQALVTLRKPHSVRRFASFEDSSIAAASLVPVGHKASALLTPPSRGPKVIAPPPQRPPMFALR